MSARSGDDYEEVVRQLGRQPQLCGGEGLAGLGQRGVITGLGYQVTLKYVGLVKTT